MIIENNANLKKLTTFRMGGFAKNLYIPESEEELIELVNEDKARYIIGGGSNLIINNRLFDNVVSLRKMNLDFLDCGDGEFVVGSSVRLQTLVKKINEVGYGGIEYLFSVPGLVGGATVMNAGRGQAFNRCISDYIIAVKILRDKKVVWLEKRDCRFEYRKSVFSETDDVVLAVRFKFPPVQKSESEKLRKERIELCRKKQDNSAPNFGTVFCESNKTIMQMFKYLPIGRGNGISYSRKTANWMLNEGGTFTTTMALLERVKKIHKFFHSKCRTEVVIWN